MERLGRYPMSVILSFLTEREGCSLLITRQKWAKQLLPLFRLPKSLLIKQKHRHQFQVIPVPDATTRLDRLNTRRWKRRRLKPTNQTTTQRAKEEFHTRRQQQDNRSKDQDSLYPPLLRLLPIATTTKDHSPFLPGITLLVSYPRSGNTLLRSLLESVTGVVTCSDTRPDRLLSMALADKHDLVGEGLCRPPITITHWPERIGCQTYVAQRAVFVVRNPWDAMDSYWNLNLTNTHTEKVVDDIYEQHQDYFQQLVVNEMKVWLQFTKFWCESSIPILIVRYEDLIRDPRPQLERILKFYTTQSWEASLESVLSLQHGYQPKSSSSNSIGRSIQRGRYHPDLLDKLHKMDNHGWLEKFGYSVCEQDFPNNLEAFPPPPQPQNNSEPNSTMTINLPEINLRPVSCPFGRNMRNWRRKHTVDDTQPFPTVPRINKKSSC